MSRRVLVYSGMLLFAIVYLFNSYSIPIEEYRTFHPEAFYKGSTHSSEDPKSYYEKLNNSISAPKGCKTETYLSKSYSTVKESKSFIWVEEGVSKNTKDDWVSYIQSVTVSDDSGTYLKPYKHKDVIVAPKNLKFINSNIGNNSTLQNGNINIEAAVGDKYKIVFEDVLCWWCHMDDASNYTHDKIVGNAVNTEVSSLLGGTVLGYARDSTKVRFYKVSNEEHTNDTSGVTYVELDPQSYIFGE